MMEVQVDMNFIVSAPRNSRINVFRSCFVEVVEAAGFCLAAVEKSKRTKSHPHSFTLAKSLSRQARCGRQ
jgi:hypothetical protein